MQRFAGGLKLDLRDEILKGSLNRMIAAVIIADENGVLSGVAAARKEAERLGLRAARFMADGDAVKGGDEIARFQGNPKQVVKAEETLMGLLAKTSGIATAADRFRKAVNGRPKVVCGAWKKMPPLLKDAVRSAVIHGGAAFRISEDPFIYLDKNYVRILGGIRKSLESINAFNGYVKVVQLKGTEQDIVLEAQEAVQHGADIVFIDTGRMDDLKRVLSELHDSGLRQRVKIAFGSGIALKDMPQLKQLDIDIVDIGRPIVDAPLLDMRMEVLMNGSCQLFDFSSYRL